MADWVAQTNSRIILILQLKLAKTFPAVSHSCVKVLFILFYFILISPNATRHLLLFYKWQRTGGKKLFWIHSKNLWTVQGKAEGRTALRCQATLGAWCGIKFGGCLLPQEVSCNWEPSAGKNYLSSGAVLLTHSSERTSVPAPGGRERLRSSALAPLSFPD